MADKYGEKQRPDIDGRVIEGPYAKAQIALFDKDKPKAAETVCQWLLDAPGFHPAWNQYAVLVVRLRDDVPGFPPPKRQFEGTTHEMLIMALNPETRVTVELMTRYMDEDRSLSFLTPVSMVNQFIATDEEMEEIVRWAIYSIVMGAMSPEAAMSLGPHNEQWLSVLTKTLAHIRGEEHAP